MQQGRVMDHHPLDQSDPTCAEHLTWMRSLNRPSGAGRGQSLHPTMDDRTILTNLSDSFTIVDPGVIMHQSLIPDHDSG